MAVGAARPAVHRREQAGRRHKHRGRRVANAPDGYTLLFSSQAAINAALYGNLNFDFVRDIAPVAASALPPVAVNPAVPVKTVPRHRLRQGQSRQGQHGVDRHRHAVHVAGELFKVMTGSTSSMCRIAATGRR